MADIEFARRIFDDIDRFIGHLLDHEVADIDERLAAIYTAIDVLAVNPLIGRPYSGRWRELVIGKGSRGYMALYTYRILDDTVYVLALRAQNEAGYVAEIH